MRRAWLKRWLREPLLQFLLLGGLIFLLDSSLREPVPPTDHYRIHVTTQQLDVLRAAFQAEQGRMPNDNELDARLQRWLDEQMLYREALALGLDQKDSIVQRQMVQKMRFLLTDAMPVPEPSEAQLQAWLETHAERYSHAQHISFEQVFFSRGASPSQVVDQLAQAQDQLAQDPEAFSGLGDVFPAGQVILAADSETLRREFGAGFAEDLRDLPQAVWSGPIRSGLGLHLVRVTGREAGQAARLAEVRERVASDWRSHQREQANATAMQRLRQRFSIEFESRSGQEAG